MYNHSKDYNDKQGMIHLMSCIFAQFGMDKTYTDVGCGLAVYYDWAVKQGVHVNLCDGVKTREEVIPVDLTKDPIPFKSDIAICLEVAEHLEHPDHLIEQLTKVAPIVVFSAAVPRQPGQGHVNCQPPMYWVSKFNSNDFFCDDYLRWTLWNIKAIPVWYRQNIFVAEHHSVYPFYPPNQHPIHHVIHPDFIQ